MIAPTSREQIAERLAATLLGQPVVLDCFGAVGLSSAMDLADVLTELVGRLRAEAAAEALTSMADWTVRTGYADAAVLREFRDRAAALRAAHHTTSEETDHD